MQVVEANPQLRDQLAARALTALRGADGVQAAAPVDPALLADQVRPWLGEEATAATCRCPR